MYLGFLYFNNVFQFILAYHRNTSHVLILVIIYLFSNSKKKLNIYTFNSTFKSCVSQRTGFGNSSLHKEKTIFFDGVERVTDQIRSHLNYLQSAISIKDGGKVLHSIVSSYPFSNGLFKICMLRLILWLKLTQLLITIHIFPDFS